MISFSRTSSGVIKVTDFSDGSVATISNKTSEVLISTDSHAGSIEIRTSGFYKLFQANSVQHINGSVPPVRTPDAIADLLISSIFNSSQVVATPQQTASTNSTAFIAGQNISVGQVVTVGPDGKAYIYDINNENHALLTTGIATQSAVQNGSISVVMDGTVTVSGMNWAPGTVYYIGANGFPSLQPPSGPGILRVIGTGLSSSSMKLQESLSIITK